MELLGFTISGHPLDLHPEIAWETYCPISKLAHYSGQKITVCGLIIEDRLHYQGDGQLMKFISICDPTGIIEAEIFAKTYKTFGVNTVRFPVVEVDAIVRPYEADSGFSLDVLGIYKPRTIKQTMPI
ncbi:MAG: hypothetical protein V4507_01195 [Verrucomicrobiota bacterium]